MPAVNRNAPVMIAVLGLLVLSGCATPPGDGDARTFDLPDQDESEGCNEFLGWPEAPVQPRVVLETNFGDIEVEVCEGLVPETGGNFLELARTGFYDETRFHRIVAGFQMQGGDPNTRDANRSNDGLGGPAHSIPDEYEGPLRFKRDGVVAMAQGKPDEGGSQFFITFDEAGHLDGEHPVFGMVTRGFSTLEAIEAEAGSREPDGAPATEVVLERATVVAQDERPDPEPRFELWAPVTRHYVSADGGSTTVPVVVRGMGTTPLDVELSTEGDGASARVPEHVTLPAFQGQVVLVAIDVPDGEGESTVTLTARAEGREEHVELRILASGGIGSSRAEEDDRVATKYVALTKEGWLLETNRQGVYQDAGLRDLRFAWSFLWPGLRNFTASDTEGLFALLHGTPIGSGDAAEMDAGEVFTIQAGMPMEDKRLVYHLLADHKVQPQEQQDPAPGPGPF